MSQHSNCVFSYQGAVISEWSMVPVWLCHVLISPLPFHDISENKCVTSCTGHKQILVASGENFGVGKICFEAQLGGTLLATNFQNVGFWMWKAILKWMIFTEPAFPWRISQAMKACALCSIYNSEGKSSTNVFGHFILLCLQSKVTKMFCFGGAEEAVESPPSPLNFSSWRLKGCPACLCKFGINTAQGSALFCSGYQGLAVPLMDH